MRFGVLHLLGIGVGVVLACAGTADPSPQLPLPVGTYNYDALIQFYPSPTQVKTVEIIGELHITYATGDSVKGFWLADSLKTTLHYVGKNQYGGLALTAEMKTGERVIEHTMYSTQSCVAKFVGIHPESSCHLRAQSK